MARAQEDLVTRAQLAALGLGRGAVAHRLAHDRLHLILPRVLAVGSGLLTPRARLAAALLWAGDDTVLSHESAAWLWGLTPDAPQIPAVTSLGRHLADRSDVNVHQSLLDSRDLRIRHGLPVTAPALTLIDLANESTDDTIADAYAAARLAGLITEREVAATLARYPRRHGAARLQRVLATDTAKEITRSEAERRFIRLTRDAELPRPEVNVRIAGLEVDFLWRAERLVVEIDGYRFHSERRQYEQDRLRDQRLTAAGLRVMRITWRQLVETPLAVAARLALALARNETQPHGELTR